MSIIRSLINRNLFRIVASSIIKTKTPASIYTSRYILPQTVMNFSRGFGSGVVEEDVSLERRKFEPVKENKFDEIDDDYDDEEEEEESEMEYPVSDEFDNDEDEEDEDEDEDYEDEDDR